MLPAIFPRDIIHARAATRGDLVEGAIVAYLEGAPGGEARLVTHRIVGAHERGGAWSFDVRGDAQTRSVRVDASAIAYVVVSVDGRLGSWSVDGWRGRALCRWAMSSSRAFGRLRRACVVALRGAAAARRAVRTGSSRC